MKLAIEIAGEQVETEFSAANGSARLSYGEQTHVAQVSQPEPNLFVIELNQRIYRCLLDGGEIVVNGQRFPVVVRDRKHLRGNAGGAANSGKATLSAPMPGKVVLVLCAAGDEVESGQGLLVVEAMKMQNEVQSPKSGKVVDLRVVAGQTVNAGETLVVVE
jgi:biotin carboxyl carrier protein